MKTHSSPILKTLSILLAAAIFAAGCQPALAEDVAVPDTAPTVEVGGPADADFVTANAAPAVTMLFAPPSVPRDAVYDAAPAPAYPLTLQAASGADTRLAVDIAAADKATEGWPWYAKVGVVVGCVALVGLTTWAIVEARNGGSHDQDSSTHITVVGDDGSTVNVRVGSDNNSSSTSTGW